MNPNDRLKWLQDEVDNLVNRYKTESTRYKNVAFRLITDDRKNSALFERVVVRVSRVKYNYRYF